MGPPAPSSFLFPSCFLFHACPLMSSRVFQELQRLISTVYGRNSGMFGFPWTLRFSFLPLGVEDLDFILCVMWPPQHISLTLACGN